MPYKELAEDVSSLGSRRQVLCAHAEPEADHGMLCCLAHSTPIHFLMDYKPAAGHFELGEWVAGKAQRALQTPAGCNDSTAPEHKCRTDCSPGMQGCAAAATVELSCPLHTNQCLPQLHKGIRGSAEALIAVQGSKGLLNKTSPSGLFFWRSTWRGPKLIFSPNHI